MVPLTFCFPWGKGSREERKQWMREFAEAGAQHLVLTSELLGKGCADTGFLLDFHRDMREFGLDFVDSHAFWGTWSDPGMPLAQWRGTMLLRHKLAFQFCLRFGVDTMAFHTGNTFNSIFGAELTLDDYCRALTNSLEVLLPEAEKCGVTIALENQWTPLNHSSVLLKVMEYFRSEQLGLCYDTGHGHLMEQGMNFPETTVVPAIWNDLGVPVKWEEKLAEKFSPWMVNCHVHDNHGSRDEHLLPEQGTVDWPRMKKVLRDSPRLRSIQNESALHGASIAEFCRSFREFFRDFE